MGSPPLVVVPVERAGPVTRPGHPGGVVALQRSLTTAVATGHGVHGIAAALCEAIGGTVVIDDADATRLAQAGGTGEDDRQLPDWRGCPPLDHACAVRCDGWVLALVSPAGTCLGLIGWMDPDATSDATTHHPTGDDVDGTVRTALEQAALVLATELYRLRSVASNELRVWGDLASELLDSPDLERTRSHAAALGYALDRPHRALVIEAELPATPPSMMRLHQILRIVGLDGRLTTSRGNRLVCFVADTADWGRLGKELDHEGGGHLRVGVGDSHDPPELGRSLAEAELALRLSGARVARFDGMGISRFLSTDADDARLRAFVHEWLGPLEAYDDAHHAELVHTLSESLRDQHSLRATSDRIHVHLSTLKYRLRRIEELTGRDLHDPDERFNLDLACRIRATLLAQEASGILAGPGGGAVPVLSGPDSVVSGSGSPPGDSSVVEVAVLDRHGVLTSVNRAWREYSAANGGDPDRTGVGTSYLDACRSAAGDPWADLAGSAVHLAIDGDLPAPFRITMPCDSPDKSRWFELSVSSRYGDDGRCCGATVTLVSTTVH